MRVYRPSHKNKSGKRVPISKYWIKLRDHNQIVRLFTGYTDKKLTERLVYKLEQLVNYRKSSEPLTEELRKFIEGLNPKDKSKLITWGLVSSRVAMTSSLAEHIKDFGEFLSSKTSERRAQSAVSKIGRMVRACNFQSYSDISPSRAQKFFAELKSSGLSVRSCNHYLQAIKQSCSWMAQDGRASDSPIKFLKAGRVLQQDIRHYRRTLEVEEIRHLLEVTKLGLERFGMIGYERHLLYKLAIETGLRANELRSLTGASFNFGNYTVTVLDAYAKNRKQTILPLRPDTAKELEQFLGNKLPGAKAFGGSYKSLTDKTSDMIKADLAEAGIPYEDNQGRVFDFHSLRHQTATFLAAAGIHPKTAQSIMRHSNINLTMNLYTHILRGQEAEAINKLPNLSQPPGKTKEDVG